MMGLDTDPCGIKCGLIGLSGLFGCLGLIGDVHRCNESCGSVQIARFGKWEENLFFSDKILRKLVSRLDDKFVVPLDNQLHASMHAWIQNDAKRYGGTCLICEYRNLGIKYARISEAFGDGAAVITTDSKVVCRGFVDF